ncbi:tripartite motif-containing protein 2-like [Saccostrea cucullata]|uniref:tripartite motif-containing protein 2-like n=1 Tax=Saccostrea cuccullata TaxID=36930 RepID=UPI002ED284F3
MATAQGQDIICCQLCTNPVEHHCNLCHVDLCLSCIPKHMADKSKEHEVVGYTSRKEYSVVLPTCPTHEKKRCEMYCQNCQIQICIQCLMGLHKKHEFTEIHDILQEHKRQIISDTEELESTIVPKYKNINLCTDTTEFDKVLASIEDQEEKICKAVHEAGSQLKDQLAYQKKEAVRKSKESQSLAEKEVNHLVQKNKDIIKSNDATAIINYQSRIKNFHKGPVLPSFSCPKLFPGVIKGNQITEMFGLLQTRDELQKKTEMLKMMDEPVVLSTIQSPYGGKHCLWRVLCVGRDKILISGGIGTIKQINRTGSILQTIQVNDNVLTLAINSQLEPVFSLSNIPKKQTDIYIYKRNKMNVLLSTFNWFPTGLYYTRSGDLLVSMRSMDDTQSRVVKYSGTMESQKIQYDSLGQPLFSTGVTNVLLLTENGNSDICVADYAGKAVVVVNSFGGLRFKYPGNLSKQTNYRDFIPLNIATDVNTQILISDSSNNIVHIIDVDGNFIRYIEHPCKGGLSIDADHNLFIGDTVSGKMKMIKYLE